MLIPKEIRTYCATCKKHTVHAVSILSVGRKRSKLSKGERQKARRARGYGGTENSPRYQSAEWQEDLKQQGKYQ